METKVNQIITALFELEAKECHRTYFEYGNGLFRVRIVHIETRKAVYEKTVNVLEERKALKKLLKRVTAMNHCIMIFPYQCYRREFIKGEKPGEWEKCKSVIEYGENATAAKLADNSGLTIDDLENGLQYFVNYRQIITTNKRY